MPGKRPVAAVIAAEQRRIQRLFAALDDVSRYAGTQMCTGMLRQTWARITELLLRHTEAAERWYCPASLGRRLARLDPADQLLTGLHAIPKAVARVSTHEVGSPDWWLAVQDVARASDEHWRRLLSDGS